MYKHVQTPEIGEALLVKKEPGNVHTCSNLAVSVAKNDCTVGHVPRSLSKVACFFPDTRWKCHLLNYPGDYWKTGVYFCTRIVTTGVKTRPGV